MKKQFNKNYLLVSGTVAPALAALMIGKAITKQPIWPMKAQCWFIVGIAAVAGFVITKKALDESQKVVVTPTL